MQTQVSNLTTVLGSSRQETHPQQTLDENRARVVQGGHINAIIDLLQHDSLLPYVVTVLYNVLVDYGQPISPPSTTHQKSRVSGLISSPEPVQLQACEAGLSQRLTDLLSGPRLKTSRPLIGLICKILALLITQEPETSNGSPTTPRVLLNLATDKEHPVDLEDFSALTSVALAYLTHEAFQVANLPTVPFLLEAFFMSHTAFDPSDPDADADAAAQLKQVRSAFVPVLADMSALPKFIPAPAPGDSSSSSSQASPFLQHPTLHTLQGWLRGPPEHANLQSAACLALGNVARSDATCEALVGGATIHQPLTDLLARCTGAGGAAAAAASPPNAQLTHAVVSFLKNLAIPAANKPALGGLLEPGLLPKLWSTWSDTQPQSQFAAVSLGRLLLVGCPANVRRVCARLGNGQAATADADADEPEHTRTSLHALTDLFKRSDTDPTKTEVARAVATVCRVLHSSPVESVLSSEWERSLSSTISPTSTDEKSDSNPQEVPSHAAAATTTEGPPPSSSSSSPTAETRRANFYAAHPALPATLSFLLTQTRFPALRSEAWFVLALTSRRSRAGARLAHAALGPAGACRALVEAVTGRRDVSDGDDLLLAASSDGSGGAGGTVEDVLSNSVGGAAPQQQQQQMEDLGLEDLQPQQVDPAAQAGMARVDRENGLCLVAQLVRDGAGEVDPARREIYERLLVTGGELILNSRGEVASE